MSVNSAVEDTHSNHYLASYNSCIRLGVSAVVELFNFNVDQNPHYPIIASVIRGRVGPEAIEDLELIIEKLKKDQALTRGEQIVLGMVYLEAGSVGFSKKKALPCQGKEADFFVFRPDTRRKEISHSENGKKSEKTEEETPLEKKGSFSNTPLGLAEARGSAEVLGKTEAPRLVNKTLLVGHSGNSKSRNGQNTSFPHGRSSLREVTKVDKLENG